MTGVCRNRRRTAGVAALILSLGVLSFLILDQVFPLPRPGGKGDFASAVIAEDGSPLRAFPDSEGVWRYTMTLEIGRASCRERV